MGLNVLIKNANKLSPSSRTIIQRFIPFPAVGGFQRIVHLITSSCWFHAILATSCLQHIFTLQKLRFFDSAATANICNVALMRHSELSEGIDVMDNNGNVVGSSKIAARHVSILPQIYEYDGGWRCIISCSAHVCLHPSAVTKEELNLTYRGVCTMFSHFPPRRSWRPPSHVWFCRCPSLCCPPSLCPT